MIVKATHKLNLLDEGICQRDFSFERSSSEFVRIFQEKLYFFSNLLENYKLSRGTSEEIGYQLGVALALRDIAVVYERQMKLAEAERILVQAVALFEQVETRSVADARKQLEKVRELQQTTPQK